MKGFGNSTLRGGQTVFHGIRMSAGGAAWTAGTFDACITGFPGDMDR